MKKEKRNNQKVVSLLFSSLDRSKMDFSLSGVSDVLMDFSQNAAGQKISKFVSAFNASNEVKHVEYLDGFQYAGNVLQFFPHPEGYVKATPLSLGGNITGYAYNYVFNYTDHLGNVRLSYSKDPQTHQLKILEENHYYPFGLRHSVYSGGRLKGFKATLGSIGGTVLTPVTKTDYQYKYNGKEWQDELGLNMYAMDMRQYDPAIARWVVLDPVIHHSMSPYNAFDNNPVFWADPSGANSIFDQEGVSASSVTVMGSGTTISAGGAGDNNTKSQQSTTSQNSNSSNNNSHDIVWEGDPDAVVLDEVVVVNGDFEGAMNRGLQQAVNYIRNFNRLSGYGGSNSSGLPSYIRNAYKNNYDPRFSPYNPSGFSVTANLHFNALLGHGGGSLSFVMGPGQFGFVWDGYGGWGPSTVLGVSGGVDMGFLDLYGGATNLEKELSGNSASWGGQVGPLGANYSTSVEPDGTVAPQGVRQYNVNVLGWGLKGGKLGNTSVSGSNSFHKSGAKFFKF